MLATHVQAAALPIAASAPNISVDEQTTIEVIQPPCEDIADIYAKVDCFADRHGVDRWLFHHIVKAESQYDPNALGDIHMPGGSTGLVQINHYWNPSVSVDQAKNPNFALEWAGVRLAKGQCYLWSTCPF